MALLRPEKHDDLGPWLADAVGRLTSKMGLRQRSRREREKRAARPEAQPSAAEVVEKLEILGVLHQSIECLPEPYRMAIRMRFFKDLPPRQAARMLGLPVNTVRSHVQRGLEKLRTNLGILPGEADGCWAPEESARRWKTRERPVIQASDQESQDSVHRKRRRLGSR